MDFETAAAFGEVMGQFEVVLRNALHNELTAWHVRRGRPGEWHDDPSGLLDAKGHADIANARDRLRRESKPELPGSVVAELTFGFWRVLLSSRYQATLWGPALSRAFPHNPRRRRADVYTPVNYLNHLRNRAAHHEPIHALDLVRRHSMMLTVAGYVDPAVRVWLESFSRVPALLTARP